MGAVKLSPCRMLPMSNQSEIAFKKKRPWTRIDAARRERKVNIRKLKRLCLTVLKRDIEQLLEISYTNKLDATEGKLLLDYLKYLSEAIALQDLEKLEQK